MGIVISEGARNTAIYAEARRVVKQIVAADDIDHLTALIQHLNDFNMARCDPPKPKSEVYEIAYRCIREEAKGSGGESKIKSEVLQRLSRHFHVYEEVWGTHWQGKRIRIDAVVVPKDDSQWKTKEPRLGIEFKNFRGFNPSIDMKDYTKWWAQCHDYSETNFDGHGYMNVFSYNGFSHYRNRTHSETSAAFAERFWGRLGVGELRPCPEGLLFVMNGTNKIWSESRGVIDASRISMERRFGSR